MIEYQPETHQFVINCAEAVFAVFLFAIAGLLHVDLCKFPRQLFHHFQAPTKEELHLQALAAQMADIKLQMAGLSPTDDFARFFKCQRQLKKLEEEHGKLAQNLSTRNFFNTIGLNFALRGILFIAALLLAWHSGGGFVCAEMDGKWLFPANLLFPMQLMGRISGEEKDDPMAVVTMFDFLLMAMVAAKIYKIRAKQNAQIHID